MLYECAKFVHVYIYLRSIFIHLCTVVIIIVIYGGITCTCKHISSIEMNPIKL